MRASARVTHLHLEGMKSPVSRVSALCHADNCYLESEKKMVTTAEIAFDSHRFVERRWKGVCSRRSEEMPTSTRMFEMKMRRARAKLNVDDHILKESS